METPSIQSHRTAEDILITGGFILAATLIGFLLDEIEAQQVNIGMIYLLSVVLTAKYTEGYLYGMISAAAGVVLFGFFFVAPRMTFLIANGSYILTFLIMFSISAYLSYLTSQAKLEERKARKQEEDTKALYELTNELATSSSQREMIEKSLSFLERRLKYSSCFIRSDDNGRLSSPMRMSQGLLVGGKNALGPEFAWLRDAKPNAYGVLHSDNFDFWPVCIRSKLFGYLGISTQQSAHFQRADQVLVHAIADSMALTMEHQTVLAAQEKDRQEASQERFRSNLLRSISHDLRTPLTGIMGTSELMMQMTEKGTELNILAGNIHHESTWLRDLVQNILSLTRLQGGKLHIHKDLQIVEEIVEAAIASMKLRYPSRKFVFTPPEDVIAAKMDSKLFQQVLINLMDNANKHTQPGKEIEVKITENPADQSVSVAVIDNGCGLREDQISKIFTIFYTTHDKEAETARGFGLGLPICDSIAKAHGGKITAANRTDKQGAVFTITIPQN